MTGRTALGVGGFLVGGYGAFRLLELGWDNLGGTVLWLAAGVVLHDAMLAPLTIGLCLLGVRLLPRRWRGAAAGGLLVLGTVTLSAVPTLFRFGARADNPTLLDRPYLLGWLVVAAVVLVGVAAAGLAEESRAGRGGSGKDP